MKSKPSPLSPPKYSHHHLDSEPSKNPAQHHSSYPNPPFSYLPQSHPHLPSSYLPPSSHPYHPSSYPPPPYSNSSHSYPHPSSYPFDSFPPPYEDFYSSPHHPPSHYHPPSAYPHSPPSYLNSAYPRPPSYLSHLHSSSQLPPPSSSPPSIEYIPYERRWVDHIPVPRLDYLPIERCETDYYAVETQTDYLPQKRLETRREMVPTEKIDYVTQRRVERVPVNREELVTVDRVQERVEYQPVERNLVHYPRVEGEFRREAEMGGRIRYDMRGVYGNPGARVIRGGDRGNGDWNGYRSLSASQTFLNNQSYLYERQNMPQHIYNANPGVISNVPYLAQNRRFEEGVRLTNNPLAVSQHLSPKKIF